MRYFLCPFEHFSLGIPEDAVAAIMIYSGEAVKTAGGEEGGDAFFSLPHFFGMTNQEIRHGIVLKSPGAGGGDMEMEEGPRNILLVSSVEREMDIPQEEIYPLPELLLDSGILSFFTGIAFERSVMIVLIDPAVLLARIFQGMKGEAV
jgi:hypothetical protein